MNGYAQAGLYADDAIGRTRALIVSGGTGGHIFPAAVFGRWLRDRGAEVFYLSGSRPLEVEIYASLGEEPYRLSIDGSPLGVRSPGRVARRSLSLLSAFRETARYVRDSRPDAVFLFGGYVSFAPLLYCRWKGIPVTVHEQNAVAGRVTRLASRLGCRIASGWEECSGLRGPHVPVGIPVRMPERLPRERAMARLGLELPDGARVVGVAGGSLGSGPLVGELMKAAPAFDGPGEGAKGSPRTEFILLGAPPVHPSGTVPQNVHFVGRQWDMGPFYSLCDALVCRAGGSTLVEALSWGIPALTVPWMGAAGRHQEHNARCFAAMGGGAVWREKDGVSFRDALIGLLDSGQTAPGYAFGDACPALWRAAGLDGGA